MVIDQLDQLPLYAALHPGFPDAIRFLRETDLTTLPSGRIELQPNRLYAIVDFVEGRGRVGAILEVHRRFIDIQYTLAGVEEIGWRYLDTCIDPREPFDPDRDIGFFRDAPMSWNVVPPDYFAIYFPSDAHAPLAGLGPLRKVVMKVAV